MPTTDEGVTREPLALLNVCKVCGLRILLLRIQRSASEGDCTTAGSKFEENLEISRNAISER